MKKIINVLVLSLMLTASYSASAGIGLSARAVARLGNLQILRAAVSGSLAGLSLHAAMKRLQAGKVGWGTFFLVLADEGIISDTEYELLANADIATQEAFIEIISSEELSEEEKIELLSEIDL